MTEAEKLDFLKTLEQDHVCLRVFVPEIHGSLERGITPQQALRMQTEREAVYAELVGLTAEEYVIWIGQGGSVLCSGRTKAGRACRNPIVGGTLLDAKVWKELNDAGGYCSVHGG